MRCIRIICSVLILVLVPAAGRALAQSYASNLDPNMASGIQPFSAYNGGNIDTISLANLQLSLKIPLISYPQKGGKLKLDYVLRYADVGDISSSFCIYEAYGNQYYCYYGPTVPTWCLGSYFLVDDGTPLCHGFHLVDDDSLSAYSSTTPMSTDTVDVQASILTPGRAMHQMETIGGNSSYENWEAVDGSGYQIHTSYSGTGYLAKPNGIKEFFPTSGDDYRQDPNGNTITYAPDTTTYTATETYAAGVGATDTMGRVIPSLPAPTSDTTGCPVPPAVPLTPSSATTWTPPGVNGGTYPILFCYIQLSETDPIGLGCATLTGCSPLTYTGTELQSVVLPNGTSWTFEYTSDGWADLSEVIFPTGGSISYGGWHSQLFAPYANDGPPYNRCVGTRTLNPNDGVTPPSTWTYSSNGAGVTTVSSPPTVGTTPDDTVYTFGGPGNSYLLQTQLYQGSQSSGVLLKTIATQYSTPVYDYALGGINSLPTQTTVTWPNGEESKTTYTYDSQMQLYFPYESTTPPGYFSTTPQGVTASYGKVLTKSEYDYGASSPTRTTTTSWLALNNTNYLNANLLDLPSSVQVTGSGPGSLTTYGYDASGCTSGVCGNLTSVSRYLNSTGTYLTTTNVYNDDGTLASTTDPKGNTTTYGYSPCPSGAAYAGSGPTSVKNALGQITYNCYDSSTGLLTSTTDPNGLTTNYAYDDMLRTTQINYADGGQTNFTYPDPTDVDISEEITPSLNRQSFLKVDGVGREIRQAVTNGESKPYDEIGNCPLFS